MNNEKILFSFPIGEILEKFKPMISSIVAAEIAKNTPKPSLEADDWLTKKETAKLLGLSYPTITKYTRNGVLKGFRMGSSIRYKRKDILASMQQMGTT